MSNTLRTYTPGPQDDRWCPEEIHITAFCGKDWDASIQITIGNHYGQLNEKQVQDLIMVLTKRLKHEEGFCATDDDINAHMGPDGILRDDLVHREIEKMEW